MKNVYDIRYEKKLVYVLPGGNDSVLEKSIGAVHAETAVIIYLYYTDTLAEYYGYIGAIPEGIDVYIISSRGDVLEEMRRFMAALGRGNVRYAMKENRGRDVSALLVAGRDIVGRYKYVCFLHDKKEHGEDWKADTRFWIENLWGNQIGGTGYINGILELFEGHGELGILAPPEPVGEHFNTWHGYGWYNSFDITRSMAGRLGLDADIRPDRPPITFGTVLWFRSVALRKLFEAGWAYSDFDDEKLCAGDYVSYAVERIFAYVAQDAGYNTGTVMCTSYAARQMNFLQHSTCRIFREMDRYFPVNTLSDLECYMGNKGKVIEFARRNGRICLYGAGRMGRLCAAMLRQEGIEPVACMVSCSTEKEMLDGIPVVVADTLAGWQDMAVIITVYDTKMQEEIAASLEANGCYNYIRFWDWQWQYMGNGGGQCEGRADG